MCSATSWASTSGSLDLLDVEEDLLLREVLQLIAELVDLLAACGR